jgi:predicted DNA-binding WGR domain protein
MIEGASSKFWEISQEGTTLTVSYGRIGTAGTQKVTDFGTPEAASNEAARLIREKAKKGYTEVGPTGVQDIFRPPTHQDCHRQIQRFMNYTVTNFDPDAEAGADEEGRTTTPNLRDLERRVYSVRVGYEDDGETFVRRLQALLDDPKVGDLKGLVIGPWFCEYDEDGPGHVAELLLAHAPRLRSLKGLFIGDILGEEAEISWIHQCDWGKLLSALPALEQVLIRGGEGLELKDLRHPRLRSITLQTGGLSKTTLEDLLQADLPALRALTLWLGVDDYGGDITVEDLAPLLSGQLFPELEHLGLQDSEDQDDIAQAVANSPLITRLKGLDLSMGTISDRGAEALLACPAVAGLRWLNLRHNYFSEAMIKRLKGICAEVNLSDRIKADGPNDRYVEVSE